MKHGSVVRVVYKEMVEGDFKKTKAKSNVSTNGGGARDLRFRPYDRFLPIFRELFPGSEKKLRVARKSKSKNKATAAQDESIEIRVGELYWEDEVGAKHAVARFWPPTPSRPKEGRIATVHKYPPVAGMPPLDEGRIVVLLIQRRDGTVWPHYATEMSLRSGDWDAEVADEILRCLDAHKGGETARGYIDFERDTRFCDAGVQ